MARLAKPLSTPHSLIPATAFAQLPWWGKLSTEEQRIVEKESQDLARAQFHSGASKLEMGKHLIVLRDRLERHGVFVRYLSSFRMSQRTAYRYIDAFKNASKRFPENVLAVVLARGLDMLGDSPDMPYGKYTPIMKALPPPKTSETKVINDWANDVEKKYKDYRGKLNAGEILPPDHSIPSSDTLLKEAFRAVRVRLRRLPTTGKARAKFVQELAGMLLAEIGVSGSQSVQVITAPEDFKQGRGYPKGRPRNQTIQ